jgi:hypothetical protein
MCNEGKPKLFQRQKLDTNKFTVSVYLELINGIKYSLHYQFKYLNESAVNLRLIGQFIIVFNRIKLKYHIWFL